MECDGGEVGWFLRKSVNWVQRAVRKKTRRAELCAPLVAASVKLHGTRPWHLQRVACASYNRARESPRRKAVASSELRAPLITARVNLDGARPWHRFTFRVL